jgi:MoaA/NifB/PqqE/SkfB family radical SAM enzyme
MDLPKIINSNGNKAKLSVSAIIPIVLNGISSIVTLIELLSKFKPCKLLLGITLSVTLFTMIYFIILMYYTHKRNKKYEMFTSRNEIPKKYLHKGILNKILKKKINTDITIIGRSNLTWFADNLINMYNDELLQYCQFIIVIQYDFVKNDNVDEETNKKLIDEYKVVTDKYAKIISKIGLKSNFALYLTAKKIENSMTYINYRNNHEEIWYDLTQAPSDRPVILLKDDFIPTDILARAKNVIYEKNCKTWSDYKAECKSAENKTNELINDFTFKEKEQRGNEARKWATIFFDLKSKLRNNEQFIPPISIQTLITNKCTSNCLMCNHYKIANDKSMKINELQNMYEYINEIGTKNIIISGGEPLSEDFCLSLIKEIKVNYSFNIGLLTNGIKNNMEPITLEDAYKLKETCKWVQLSIDSFSEDTYNEIRKNAKFGVIKNSVSNLEHADVNFEVCYTIQKKNIDEAIKIISGQMPYITTKRVRFKFVHCISENPNDFVIGDNREKVVDLFSNTYSGVQNNISFLQKMYSKGHYIIEDILSGKPISSKIGEFKTNKYQCFMPYFQCLIDAEANVYPCCLLGDDNSGISSIRNKHVIGSLRDKESQRVLKLGDDNINELKEILINNSQKIKKYIIPEDRDACRNCTRHILQNEFFNKLDIIYRKYQNIGYPDFMKEIKEEPINYLSF